MVSWINDVLRRLVALEKEATLAAIGQTPDAYPYFFVAAEKPPYWTNRLATNPITDDGSEVEDVLAPIFIARFVIGHVTSGVKGERETELYEVLPVAAKLINERELLQSTTYPTRPPDFFRARCFDGGGFRIFDNSGIGTQQYGAELQIRIDRDEFIEQDYLGD